ncbi:MAG: tail fiber domain-containing protein [Bacteroidales bacterium]|nr:tail fiber domain-containing protein [Bacteroidales bacterium]
MKINTPSAEFESSGVPSMSVPQAEIRINGSDTFGFVFSSNFSMYSLAPGPFGPYPDKAIFRGLTASTLMIGTLEIPMSEVYADYVVTTGTGLGPYSASDVRLKKNIVKLSSVQNKMMSLNVVKYDFIRTLGGKDVSNDPAYKSKVGLLAQEVKDIFPDIVYHLSEDSIYALDYAGFIPYLIKSEQELQSQIVEQQDAIVVLKKELERQEQVISDLQETISTLQDKSFENKEKSQVESNHHKLFQNVPNPFNQSTKIEYVLSDNVNSAKICIYNLNGNQLRCFVLNTVRGTSSIEINASDLHAGIYLYSLIVDNKLIATKRMILTE